MNRLATAVERHTGAAEATEAFASLKSEEFERAKAAMADLAEFQDYDDWQDFREGSLLSLDMAGIRTRVVPVELRSFLRWCERFARKADQLALDDYAREVDEVVS